LYVLGVISNGDGGLEAERLLGLLGLPNDTTMEGKSFANIEDRIAPTILKVNNEIIHENLIEEVNNATPNMNFRSGDKLWRRIIWN
jgi:hypothetical protein